jgi:hypothetical protein
MHNNFAGCGALRAGNGSWTAPPRDFRRHAASGKAAGGESVSLPAGKGSKAVPGGRGQSHRAGRLLPLGLLLSLIFV